jgi:hypothetical protein
MYYKIPLLGGVIVLFVVPGGAPENDVSFFKKFQKLLTPILAILAKIAPDVRLSSNSMLSPLEFRARAKNGL